MSLPRPLLALGQDGLEMLLDLAETGDLERYGLPSSNERLDKLLTLIATETVNILRAELETLSVEQRGKTGIKKVMRLVEEAKQLGLPLEATLREQMYADRGTPRKLHRTPTKEST